MVFVWSGRDSGGGDKFLCNNDIGIGGGVEYPSPNHQKPELVFVFFADPGSYFLDFALDVFLRILSNMRKQSLCPHSCGGNLELTEIFFNTDTQPLH
jgi:hypothetical protein